MFQHQDNDCGDVLIVYAFLVQERETLPLHRSSRRISVKLPSVNSRSNQIGIEQCWRCCSEEGETMPTANRFKANIDG
jgi:hypothetical protein